MDSADDRQVEELESLLQACHSMLRNLEHATVPDDGLAEVLRDACRRIEARLRRLIAAA